MNKIPCSVGILTFNSGFSLRKCLESVKNFDDIVICDGGSTDNTYDIAKEYHCKIINQNQCFKNPDNSISDFSGVRNQLLDATIHDWFMFIDSDEYISTDLAEEINSIVVHNASQPSIFKVPRMYVKNGCIVDCATTYPNYQIRFFKKKSTNGFVRSVHEKIQPKNGSIVSELKNFEYVPLQDVKSLKQKWKKYLDIEMKNENEGTLITWIRSCFLHHFLISGLYCFRYMRILFSCKGNRMPLLYEYLRLWYNFQVVKIGLYCLIKKYKKEFFR